MKSENVYFIRHNLFDSRGKEIENEIRGILKKNTSIAIHFNNDRITDDEWEYTINNSSDPKFKKAAKIFSELKKNGGYVLAQYNINEGIVIGRVAQGTKITYLDELENRNDVKYKGFKCLKFEDERPFKLTDFPILFAITIPFVTLAKMKDKKAEIIREIYENNKLTSALDRLTPQFIELIVQEWLRSTLAKDLQLSYQLILTGKDYPSVDIIGKTKKGKTLFAQVTFHDEKSSKEKFERFKEFAFAEKNKASNCVYVMFSNERSELNGDPKLKNINEVFEELQNDSTYKSFIKTLFEGIEE